MAEEFDTDYTSEVVCPYCGHQHRDSWELLEDCDTYECVSCEKEFEYQRETEVTYCTWKKDKTPAKGV